MSKMATFSFDRPFVVSKKESVKRLESIINSDKPAHPISVPAYSDSEKRKSEELLERYYFHSAH